MRNEEEGHHGEEMISLDKEIIFVVKLHETLVTNFDVIPMSISLRNDPEFGPVEGEFVLEYDLGFGEMLVLTCKREGGNMLIALESGDKIMNYSVLLDMYVDDDFMPVTDGEFSMLIENWFE
ncbi:MAG: hypothetical protein OEV21_04590 [Thermoplasmata archaeon]|nr:hypothetical protein [Thermoplasmata archaeon]